MIQLRTGAGWGTITETITHPGAGPLNYGPFVYIDISADGGTVGASVDDDDVGSILVWQGSGSTYTLAAELTIVPVGSWYNFFGSDFSINADGSIIWANAPARTHDEGDTFGAVFKFSGTLWATQMELTGADLGFEAFYDMEEFIATTADGNTVVVGNVYSQDPPNEDGQVFIGGGGTPLVEAISEWCGPFPCDVPFASKLVTLESPNGDNPDSVIMSFAFREDDDITESQSVQLRKDGIWVNPSMVEPPIWTKLGLETAVAGIVADATTAHACALTDAGKVIRMTNAAANTVTIPSNTTVAFPVNSVLGVRQAGAGSTTVVAAGGVTINKPNSLVLREQHSECALRKVGTNEWDLSGDMVP